MSVYMDREDARRLAKLSKIDGVSQSQLMADALHFLLSPQGGKAYADAVFRRLTEIAHQLEHIERSQQLQIEALALFIRHQFTVAPSIAEAHQAAARAQGRARFLQFIDQLARHLQSGGSLVKDVWQEMGAAPRTTEEKSS